MAGDSKFKALAPKVMGWLMADFGLNDLQAAGVLGNLGHESAGFEILHEIGQPEGSGGYGWAQWTGPRRTAFFDWCNNKGLDWRSDDANYGFLRHELQTSERATIPALKGANTLSEAVRTFQEVFERPGIIRPEGRDEWAVKALAAFNASLGLVTP
jgi:tail lysozyme